MTNETVTIDKKYVEFLEKSLLAAIRKIDPVYPDGACYDIWMVGVGLFGVSDSMDHGDLINFYYKHIGEKK